MNSSCRCCFHGSSVSAGMSQRRIREKQEKSNEPPARGQVRNTRGMKMVSGGIDSRNTGKAEKQ